MQFNLLSIYVPREMKSYINAFITTAKTMHFIWLEKMRFHVKIPTETIVVEKIINHQMPTLMPFHVAGKKLHIDFIVDRKKGT